MINPAPPIHSDVTIVLEDSCNCSCYPCRRWSKSPDKDDSDKTNHQVVRSTSGIFSRIFGNITWKK